MEDNKTRIFNGQMLLVNFSQPLFANELKKIIEFLEHSTISRTPVVKLDNFPGALYRYVPKSIYSNALQRRIIEGCIAMEKWNISRFIGFEVGDAEAEETSWQPIWLT